MINPKLNLKGGGIFFFIPCHFGTRDIKYGLIHADDSITSPINMRSKKLLFWQYKRNVMDLVNKL